MSLLLLFAGAAQSTPAPPTVLVDEGGPMGHIPTPRSIRQLEEWRAKWDDNDVATALAAILLL